MSYAGYDEPEDAWSINASSASGDIVKDAMRKEQIIKEITAAQEDLRVLLERVKSVEQDADKLTSGNATLQMYIDNLTMQMAKRR
ncbi:hypothetical protein FA95DRAFT_1487360 [Auriscalpium vulgare]|uniref:Uncharacterized protein n=1 Tax=Auriscalpium vulgare TaxID=40419 RepID=A0ACB8S3L3_9AGAM|nr:hypothetical protein FA95DRAFT_1487360 [Auriscalpium vulgare]